DQCGREVRRECPPGSRAGRDAHEKRAMTQAGRILLADDEETFAESTADLLRRAGYECDTAGEASAAASLLAAAKDDLLIADIRMPGNVELDLLRHVAETQRTLPVILVTAAGFSPPAVCIKASCAARKRARRSPTALMMSS